MSAIEADYRTNKHIPSRKCYQLILEVTEEDFPNVCQVLGYPKTGENTYVAIALLDKSIVTKHETNCDKTEGEKLRTRAAILCESFEFQEYCRNKYIISADEVRKLASIARCIYADAYCMKVIYAECGIKSRSEIATSLDAQNKFKQLLEKYKTWQLENQYSDNLDRI